MSADEEINDDDNPPMMSERVQLLAKQIYDELEALVDEYGPESITNMMPLVVNILENLDSTLSDNQDNLSALMDINDENQQLIAQYEKEKNKRKEFEEKMIQIEDSTESEITKLKENIAISTGEKKSYRMKIQAQIEQIEKLEEKQETMKKEQKELQDRNREIIRNYHGQIETLRETHAAKISDIKRNHGDDITGSASVSRVPGFQDFTSSKVNADRKKRLQPAIPRKQRTFSFEDEELIGTTPFQRADSDEYYEEENGDPRSPSNQVSLADEYQEEQEYTSDQLFEGGMEFESDQHVNEGPINEQSLFAEMSGTETNFSGLDDILMENKQLHTEKEELVRELEMMLKRITDLEMEKGQVETDLENLQNHSTNQETELKKVKKDLQESREKLKKNEEIAETHTGPEGLRISRLEIAKVLRERNEWKEKYFSLLEQVRMNDELYLFKKKDKKSRWVDYFAALFSTNRRRQLEQSLADSSAHRPILNPSMNSSDAGESDHGVPFTGAGYSNTGIVPTLKRVGKKEDEVYMTSLSWVIPNLNLPDSESSPATSPVNPPPIAPNINTCRPMNFQDEGAKILCVASVNQASFLSDCSKALSVAKGSELANSDEQSMSLVWVCTGTENLTKVNILDAAAVGEVLETFAVCSSSIDCICVVPEFDDQDTDVLSSLSTKAPKPKPSEVRQALNERPSSIKPTVWMGSDAGVLYVHSAFSQWKKCIHADKLPHGIKAISHSKGKVFVLMANGTVGVFLRFPDGQWDWDHYEMVIVSQNRKNLPVTTMIPVKYTMWCAIGNSIHVLHSHNLTNEGSFVVHAWKQAEVLQMICVGEGVWVAFKHDSVLRLFNVTSFTHMQDLDIAPSIHKVLVFGSEKRSNQMPVPISCIVAAHSSLWVGTENGIILSYPFSLPNMVAEESGWEVIKEAEITSEPVPEPFDVRTEEALDASLSLTSSKSSPNTTRSSGPPMTSSPMPARKNKSQPFNPFCNIDQLQLSIHCHVNTVKGLVCVPGMAPNDISAFEPLGGVYIGPGEEAPIRPTLFVLSCGEGHLDLRTADKVMQTVHAQERSGLPSPTSVISEKNYIMVWDITA